MKRSFRFMLLLALLGLALGLSAPWQNAQAAPPEQGGTGTKTPGYSLLYSISSDPTSLKYVASFTPDVQSIYAFAVVVAANGAPEKQFTIDIQFLSPTGQKVTSKWYQGDTGTVTTVKDTDAEAGNVSTKNVTRRQLDVAGTPNAKLTGEWSINFSSGGKVVSVGNFTLANAQQVANSDAATSAQAELEAKYNVTAFDSTTTADGTEVGVAIMEMVSQDIYSSDTAQQVIDGYTALHKAFPTAAFLVSALAYNERYEVVYIIKTPDFDAYLKSGDFAKFAGALNIRIFDNQTDEYLENSKDFIRKNFGAGNLQSPVTVPSVTSSSIGSVRVQASPSELPPDGTAQITITVFDKRNNPLANTELTLDVSGAGQGTIRPKVTSTDSKGQATATFTAGKKEGAVNITVTAGKTTGTAVVTVKASTTTTTTTSDPQADNVSAYLASKGYKTIGVVYDSNKQTAVVGIDLGTGWDINKLALPILYGMAALRDAYPQATSLGVMIPYQQYIVVFPSAASNVDTLVVALQAAGSDKQKQTQAFDAFFTPIFNAATVIDAKTGQTISTFKDFLRKDFGGG